MPIVGKFKDSDAPFVHVLMAVVGPLLMARGISEGQTVYIVATEDGTYYAEDMKLWEGRDIIYAKVSGLKRGRAAIEVGYVAYGKMVPLIRARLSEVIFLAGKKPALA